jgi:CIC family chloride channel protein
VGAAVVAVLYINALQVFETLAERKGPVPTWLKPAIGGLIVGLLGFIVRPEIFGTGYATIESAFRNPSMDWTLFIVLVFLKLIATTVTLGSGGQGGLFAPSLFLGAMLGVGFGLGLDAQFPGLGIAPPAYGLVGMAAVLAGAVRAPITAIVLPFEMTNDYRIIVPLMTAAILSYLISQKLQPDSVYTQRHRKRGIDLSAQKDENLMRAIRVQEAMTQADHMITVPVTMPLKELLRRFQQSGRHSFPVVGDQGELFGMVSLSDLERAVSAGQVEGSVADIYTREVFAAFPDESLEDALAHLSAQDFAVIPVVDRRDPRRLVGVLRRSDILRAYSRSLADLTRLTRQRERLKLQGMTGSELLEIDLAAGSPVLGKKLRELKLPQDVVFVSIHRGQRVLIPHGDTVLQAKDRVLAITIPKRVPDLLKLLKGPVSHDQS